MLIEFSVGNYLSFKDVVTFSMVATDDPLHKETHVFESAGYNLLNSSVVYGANASGKSNLFKSMSFARDFIVNSSKESQIGKKINIESFLLSPKPKNKPSFFEFVFIKNSIKYRYGFRANAKMIIEEWLFRTNEVEESRTLGETSPNLENTCNFINFNVVASYIEGLNIKIKDRETRQKPELLNILRGKEELKDKFLKILKKVDLSIENIFIENKEGQLRVKTVYKKPSNNEEDTFVVFDLETQESSGMQNLVSTLIHILISLKNGSILVVDEMGSNLHPKVLAVLVDLFNSSTHNPHNAQLIFSTHNTSLLNKELFRKDQIWFTEKDEYGSTDLYSLVEYEFPEGKTVRHDRSFAKDYLAGKYGAIPFIGAFD